MSAPAGTLCAADAVVAVAAGDEVARELVRHAVLCGSVTRGLRAVEVVQLTSSAS